ncbi:hypothetical protein CYMTET_29543, partial [Cymbomonas tetramitiformis]
IPARVGGLVARGRDQLARLKSWGASFVASVCMLKTQWLTLHQVEAGEAFHDALPEISDVQAGIPDADDAALATGNGVSDAAKAQGSPGESFEDEAVEEAQSTAPPGLAVHTRQPPAKPAERCMEGGGSEPGQGQQGGASSDEEFNEDELEPAWTLDFTGDAQHEGSGPPSTPSHARGRRAAHQHHSADLADPQGRSHAACRPRRPHKTQPANPRGAPSRGMALCQLIVCTPLWQPQLPLAQHLSQALTTLIP